MKDTVIPARELDEITPRIETGNLRFGSDWTGVFIRGDDAFSFGMSLKRIVEMNPALDELAKSFLTSLAELFQQSREEPKPK